MDRAKLAAADKLFQRSASIRAVQGREMNPFSQALEVLERIAEVTGDRNVEQAYSTHYLIKSRIHHRPRAANRDEQPSISNRA